MRRLWMFVAYVAIAFALGVGTKVAFGQSTSVPDQHVFIYDGGARSISPIGGSTTHSHPLYTICPVDRPHEIILNGRTCTPGGLNMQICSPAPQRFCISDADLEAMRR